MPTVTLNWDQSADNVAVDHYNVYRRTTPTAWQDPISGNLIGTAPTATYADATALANQTYAYIVQAFDSSDNASPLSDAKLAYTGAASDTTSAPQSLTLSSGFPTTTGIKFQWLAPATIPGQIAAYIIFRDGVEIAQNDAQDLNYKDNVGPSESNAYTVKARSGGGSDSPASNTLNATSLADTAAPSVPTNVVVTSPTATDVVVDWDSSTDNVSVKEYVVTRQVGGSGSYNSFTTVAHPITIVTDTGRTNGQTYRYQILAKDDALNASAAATSAAIVCGSGIGGSDVYNVPTTIDRTGATDVTVEFRDWLDTVPDGADFWNPNKINFPPDNGVDGQPAMYRMEGVFQIGQRSYLKFKFNGARILVRTSGNWFNPQDNNVDNYYWPQWPNKRMHVAIRQSNVITIQDAVIYGPNFPGNPAWAPTVDPQNSGTSLVSNLIAAVPNGTQTFIDVNFSLKNRPLWTGYGFSTSFGLPYHVWIGGDPTGIFEVVKVTAETPISGGVRLTVERGRSRPQAAAAKSWPNGTQVRPGKVGGGGNIGGNEPAYEFQSAFECTQSNFVTFTNCKSLYSWGSSFRFADSSQYVDATDCEAGWAGRQAFTPEAMNITVKNPVVHDIGAGAFCFIDIEPAADTTRCRDIVIDGGIWWGSGNNANLLGYGGRGRVAVNDGTGRYTVDNIVLKNIDTDTTLGVRGDFPGGWVTDGPRGTFTMIDCLGRRMWGSPVPMINLYRQKGVTILRNTCSIYTLQNRKPITLNKFCQGFDSSDTLQAALSGPSTPNPVVRVDNGGSIGRRTPTLADDNDWPGADADWTGSDA